MPHNLLSLSLDVFVLCVNICLILVCIFSPCSPDLIPAFKDITLDSLKAAGVGPSPVASAPSPAPPSPAAAAPPAAPGSSYPTHMKVSVFLHKQSTVRCGAV